MASQSQYSSMPASQSQQGSQGPVGGESYQMSSVGGAPPAMSGSQAYVNPLDQRSFLQQVGVVKELLKDFDDSLGEISRLHQALLDAVDASSSSGYASSLQNVEATMLARNEQVKKATMTLAQDAANTPDEGLRQLKQKQVGPLRREFQSKISQYQRVEQEYRSRRQDQIRRQYLVVNPDATDTELSAVADTSNDPQSQNVFQNAVCQAPSSADDPY